MLTVYVRSCRNVRHSAQCGCVEITVRTSLLLAEEKVQRCGPADLFYCVCTYLVVASHIAVALAQYGWSDRSIRHNVGCGGDEMIVYTALLLAMSKNEKE